MAALSHLPLNFPAAFSPSNHFPCPSHSLHSLLPQTLTHSCRTAGALKIKPCRCNCTVQVETHRPEPAKVAHEVVQRKRRKARPSFFEQIQDKWSFKVESPREKFPWQTEEKEEQREQKEAQPKQSPGVVPPSGSGTNGSSSLEDSANFALGNRLISAPWAHGGKPRKTQFVSEIKIPKNHEKGEDADWVLGDSEKNDRRVAVARSQGIQREIDEKSKYNNGDVKIEKTLIGLAEGVSLNDSPIGAVKDVSLNNFSESKEDSRGDSTSVLSDSIGLFDNKSVLLDGDVRGVRLNPITGFDKGFRTPWKKEKEMELDGSDRWKRSNTKVAESTVPEHELQRLRRVSLRMVERIKVGAAGITQALVDSIHEKWKVDEVVKLKFEGPSALNMKRVHKILESKTGGLVIWRSGSSLVLYRGMTYKLHCVQQFARQSQPSASFSISSKDMGFDANSRVEVEDSVKMTSSFVSDSVRERSRLSEEELVDMDELNKLLDILGPRFEDWSGCKPLPVDADLLPSVVPGYQPPFRLLPYGIRHGLRDTQMTYFRRLARRTPPHFALGRNRELQGLAMAMVKLWEESAIAKIAIKRGVQNTCNDRMAEELKKLTGGTLLSRNKEFIVFYRGNDFLPPHVTEKLKSRQKLRDLQEDEEDQARMNASALVNMKTKTNRGALVAGTLAETMAATSRWGNLPSSKDVEEMMEKSALDRHNSLVKYLEKKLALQKGKMKRAEKALAKVQKDLEPAGLPDDLETISDEERFLFRKIGLSMKPYLLLGRRGIFDGVVENMHLHWKYREVVKIIVRRKTFPQVKHIAVSLEAESGGVLVSLDKTTQGHAIIFYRGKNYQRPRALRPNNLLTKRQALARSIELQRREALKHHILELQERIELLKSELENMTTVKEIDEETFYSRMNDAYSSDDDMDDDEDEEAYLETYDSEGGKVEDNLLLGGELL